MSEKSLQININTIEDAKSVVQHLKEIKDAYDAHQCSSVEFCIAEPVVTATTPILTGIVPWCRNFRKIVKPFEGNVFFTLPAFQSVAPRSATPPPPVSNREPVQRRGRRMGRRNGFESLGKSAPLVTAQPVESV